MPAIRSAPLPTATSVKGTKLLSRMVLCASMILPMAAHSQNVAANAPNWQADLQFLTSQAVYFGHQSVGDNLLAGVAQIAAQANVPIRIVELPTADGVSTPVFGHTHVAENTFPLKKLASFEQALSRPAPQVKVAALKFCYVDVNMGTDVAQLFQAYQRTVSTIQAQQPGLQLLHMTVPLTTVQTNWKASLKRLMGKAPYGVLENIRREEYNQLLRQAYGSSGRLFDLARVEATLPDGQLNTVEWNGKQVPALVPSYSDDGEHLNAAGQAHAAKAFVSALANAARKP